MTGMRVVILTSSHTIAGELAVTGKRLSDVLNDQRESVLHLQDVSISRLAMRDDPVQRLPSAIVSKHQAVVVFEENVQHAERKLVGYVPKRQYDAFLIAANLEVRGQIHAVDLRGPMDLHRLVAERQEGFLPVTDARLIPLGADLSGIERAAVLVNARYIHAVGLRGAAGAG